MKKIISIILVAVIIFALGGCTKNKVNGKTSSKNISSSQKQKTISSENSSSMITSSDDTSSVADTPTIATPIDVNGINIADLEQYENAKKGWGQGVRFDKQNRPVTCDPYQIKYGESGGLFIMPNDEKKMYLTFDEGYENGYTPKILDALKEKKCHGVFFVTMDYVKRNPDLIKRMIDEGNTVGNHTVKHKSMPTLTSEQAIQEISELHNYMVENYNYTMTLFRPPMGEFSTRTLVIAQKLGYKTVLWSYAYADYDPKKQMGVDKAFPRVTKRAHNGAIYLLHAVSKDNAEMMGDLIDNFRENGFSLELLK